MKERDEVNSVEREMGRTKEKGHESGYVTAADSITRTVTVGDSSFVVMHKTVVTCKTRRRW